MTREAPWLRICLYTLSTVWLLGLTGRCFAHDDPNTAVPSLRALKVDQPITVDGVLDEPFWQDAKVGSEFIDARSGQLADQQTAVRVAYTRTRLYVAVGCFDDQIGEIHTSKITD